MYSLPVKEFQYYLAIWASQSTLITTCPLFPIELKVKTQLGIFKFCHSPIWSGFFCLQSLKEVLQVLIDNFNKSIKKAEVHRKSASAKN